ncbi:MAG: histidine phosphatase family protein [Rhizobiaceae bacterium]|nr:histidine phosphatase family protein [Rhizobiaceae bacterium]
MATLYLLRHAKAGWAQPGIRDFDRPLDDTGLRECDQIGDAMSLNGYVPDHTLCSGALRARQTLAGIAAKTDTGKIEFSDTLYMTDATGYLELIRKHQDASSLLVIGHNPMMEDLTVAISGSGNQAALDALNAGFSTAGLAVIEFAKGLGTAAPGKGRLEAYIVPGD